MDGQEYLSQISADTRPVKAPGGAPKFLRSKFFMVGAIGIIGLIIIIIIGSLIGGNANDEKNKIVALKLHAENTTAVIKDYQTNVKSSTLRSHLASLSSVLANTTKSIDNYLTEKYSNKDKDAEKTLTAEAETAKESLSAELFAAKINGLLDRTIAHKMVYEISIIINEETTIYNATKSENLKNILEESYNSLETLYSKFDNFKEGQ